MNEKLIKYLKSGAKPHLLEVHPKLKSVGFNPVAEVYRARCNPHASVFTPAIRTHRLVQPAAVSARQLLEFDRLADSVLSSFERLELSPFVHSVRIRS